MQSCHIFLMQSMQADMQHRFAVDEDIADDIQEKLALGTSKQRVFHITQCCIYWIFMQRICSYTIISIRILKQLIIHSQEVVGCNVLYRGSLLWLHMSVVMSRISSSRINESKNCNCTINVLTTMVFVRYKTVLYLLSTFVVGTSYNCNLLLSFILLRGCYIQDCR